MPGPELIVRFTGGFEQKKVRKEQSSLACRAGGEAGLAEVERFIGENAARLLGFSPEIFPVSAKLAQRAKEVEPGPERDELWELLLAHAWERIRRYPLERRPRRIAANVLLDTLRRTMRELERERRRRHRSVPDATVEAPSPDRRAEVARMLLDAVSAGAISQLEAQVIFETRIERCSLAEVAADVGLAYNVLRVRLQRAERRLLLHLGHPAVPKRRAKGPFSSAQVTGATRTGQTSANRDQQG